MGVLIAVEGLDGAGKRTLVQGLIAECEARGLTARSLSFPRYGRSTPADVAAEALRGGHVGLSESVHAMALLFAFDRYEARDHLHRTVADTDVVVLDRYVASNAAYGAARLHQAAGDRFAGWIGELEFGRLGLPVPDLQLLLEVPVEVAADRARRRGDDDAGRALDSYERDDSLQQRTAQVYHGLAEMHWYGPWRVSRDGDDLGETAASIAGLRVPNRDGMRR